MLSIAAQELAVAPVNQSLFLLKAVLEGHRPDGRFLLDSRKISLAFERFDGRATAEVCLGDTRAFAEVTAEVAEPMNDRPLDGFLNFNVVLTPMSSAGADTSRNNPLATEIKRILERQIRDSQAIDTESLCISPGEAVWSINVTVKILCNRGNVIDASSLATLGALLHFRRADVTHAGGKVTIHSYSESVPLPLAMHHHPITVSFSIFSPDSFGELSRAIKLGNIEPPSHQKRVKEGDSGKVSAIQVPPNDEVFVLDPTDLEENVGSGVISFTMNAHGELCGVHNVGGAAVTTKTLAQASYVAAEKAAQIIAVLKAALASASQEYDEKIAKQHAAAAGFGVAGTADLELQSK